MNGAYYELVQHLCSCEGRFEKQDLNLLQTSVANVKSEWGTLRQVWDSACRESPVTRPRACLLFRRKVLLLTYFPSMSPYFLTRILSKFEGAMAKKAFRIVSCGARRNGACRSAYNHRLQQTAHWLDLESSNIPNVSKIRGARRHWQIANVDQMYFFHDSICSWIEKSEPCKDIQKACSKMHLSNVIPQHHSE